MPEICLATNETDHCSCGALFTVDHSLSCPTGGYPAIRNNEVWDLWHDLLTDMCYYVQ